MNMATRFLAVVAAALLLPGVACPQVAQQLATVAAEVPAATAYKDRNGYFDFQPPAGWVQKDYPDDARSKVQFTDPRSGAYIRLIVRAETESTPATFAADKREAIDDVRQKLGGKISRLTQAPGQFLDHPAYFVRLTLAASEVEQTFFLANQLQFNIWYEAPTEALLRASRAVAMRSLESIRVRGQGSTGTAREHGSARALRLAQLLSAHGDFDGALEQVQDGLRDDPGNAQLKKALQLLQQRKTVPDPLPR